MSTASPSDSTSENPVETLRLRIAVEFVPRGWQRPLVQLCEQLEAGRSWEESIHVDQWQAPPPLRALMRAAYDSGQPGRVFLMVMQQRCTSMSAWRELKAALVYPGTMLLISLSVALATGKILSDLLDVSYLEQWGVPNSELFGGILADQQNIVFGASLALGWLLLVGVTLRLLATPIVWLKLMGELPLLGRPYRWLALSDLLARMAIISQLQPRLEVGLRTTAESYGKAATASIVRRIADRVESGMSFPNAIHRTILSDSRAGVVLAMLENPLSAESLVEPGGEQSGFVTALTRSSELLQQMATESLERLKLVLPIFFLVIVGGIVWSTWCTYLLALLALNSLANFL